MAPTTAFQGGTLNGLREQLDYLQELGVGAIWLSPVQKLPVSGKLPRLRHPGFCRHRSSTGLGSRGGAARSDPGGAGLRALVDAAHQRSIYVIFDIVLNHTGDVFEYQLDDGRRDGMAPWRDTPYSIRWRDADGQARGLGHRACRSKPGCGHLAARAAP